MKSFLDTDQPKTKTYLLYGQLNDLTIGPDLIIRPIEAALVRMLKDRGYKHIIFYGTEGNCGGYCLDAESARFFFSRNCGLPLPQAIDVDGRSVQAQPHTIVEPAQPPQRGMVRSMLRCRSNSGYTPGDAPRQGESLPAQQSAQPLQQTAPQPPQAAPARPEAPAQVVYAMRNWTLSEFFAQIQSLMLKPDSHMAVVFYNIVNSHLYNSQALLDSIRHGWEQSTADNICLLMAQGGDGNSQEILSILNRCALTDKFIIGGAQGSFNSETTHCFGRPDADEVCNLLTRLRVVGTPLHRRITLDCSAMEQLADMILYCQQTGSLRNIYDRLCRYIDAQSGNEPVRIDKAVIERIWHMQRRDEKSALEQLNRPGWEAVYQLICDIKRRVERYRQEHTASPAVNDNHWGIGRFSLPSEEVWQELPKIPNIMLLGNPGTGKTTIARLIGSILHELGLLRRGHVHEVTRSSLSDEFINGPARRTRDAIRAAEGGVLFIDEAHRIASSDGGRNGQDFGSSIVSELNNATGEHQRFSLVIAGYERDMQAVLALDPGFRRRFENNVVVIQDYQPPLLQSIFLQSIDQNGCTLDPELLKPIPAAQGEVTPLHCLFERIYNERNRRSFGNAADMKTLAENVCGRVDPTDNIVRREHFIANGYTEEYFAPHNVDNSLDAVLKDFDCRFVGMQDIRTMLRDRALELQEALDCGCSVETLRAMILVGNPGTGKTSVAEMLARIYFGLGLLGTADPLIVSASSLSSPYQGGATEAIQRHITNAQDRKALLFIDEAHQMAQPGLEQAFRALMQPLTDRAHPFMLVLASYPDELKKLLAIDPGSTSRFDIVELNDYTGEELHAILHRMMNAQRVIAPKDVDAELRRVCDYISKMANKDTGNGRAMENLLREMNSLRRRRCVEAQIPFSDSASRILARQDIPQDLLEKLPAENEDCYSVTNSLLEEIERDYVGLQPVRDYIRNLSTCVAEMLARGEDPYRMQLPALIVTGNAGVGKSLSISLLAKAFYRLHLVAEEAPLTVNAADMLSSHVNGNRLLANQHIQQVRDKNSFLVVEKAHILAEEQSHGSDVLQQFVASLSAPERSIRVAFEVYNDAKESFLRLDDDLLTLTQVIELKDYTGEELFEILQKIAAHKRWILSEKIHAALRNYCKFLYQSRSSDSGNARQMENLIGQLATRHRRRCECEGITPDTDRYWILTEADLPEQVARASTGSDPKQEILRLKGILERMETERSGCEDMKNIIKNRIDRLIYHLRYPSRRRPVEPGHFFFLGSSGTGKTTAAKFLAKYFAEIGIISDGTLYKTTASDLIAGYLGQTQSKTREKLMAGRGRVMLIDEAYALAGSQSSDADSFKYDALTELVSFLDDEQLRKVTCVIFAGYKDDMNRLYQMNQGLASRVSEVSFPDFDVEQCMNVFCSIASENMYEVDEDTKNKLYDVFARIRQHRGFSNGRTVRRLCELICREAEQRSLNADYEEDDERVGRMMVEDIPSTQQILRDLNLG